MAMSAEQNLLPFIGIGDVSMSEKILERNKKTLTPHKQAKHVHLLVFCDYDCSFFEKKVKRLHSIQNLIKYQIKY